MLCLACKEHLLKPQCITYCVEGGSCVIVNQRASNTDLASVGVHLEVLEGSTAVLDSSVHQLAVRGLTTEEK